MKQKTYYLLIILITISSLYSCNNNTENTEDEDDFDIENIDTTKIIADTLHAKKVKKIFYNVPSPIEMANLMQKANVVFDKTLLNPVNKKDTYITIEKVALNLGVYGADLSYTRMFDQIQESVNILSAVRKLSDALGIPQDAGSSTISKMEDNMENRDSLLQIITNTYASADSYLKENERGSTATLIIIGGWVEALYIATQVEPKNEQINTRIAEQKFSLNNLIELIKSYPETEAPYKYLPQLENLKNIFDEINITYKRGEVRVDEKSKKTIIDNKAIVEVSDSQINEIKQKIEKNIGEIKN